MGRMQAAWDQYSKAWGRDGGAPVDAAVQYALSTVVRPMAPRRAYGMSSWERARTEIVSSWTAPRCRRTPRTPDLRSGAPRKPWARRAIRRASSAVSSVVGRGREVMLRRVGEGTDSGA